MRELAELLDQRVAVLDGAWGTMLQGKKLSAADYHVDGHQRDTAGDPDLPFTRELLPAAAEAGADLFEVGFPFSDPIADGPVIQASYTRALDKHLKLARSLRPAWGSELEEG